MIYAIERIGAEDRNFQGKKHIMGTRSLTKVIQTYSYRDEEGKEHKSEFTLVNMYRQMDGYPEGHGKELAEFLKNIHIVNGMQGGETRQIANGAGCLAAQMVKHLKEGPGGIYLYPIRSNTQDYEYIIRVDEDKLSMQMDIYYTELERKKLIFRGTPSELLEIDFARQREELEKIRQRKQRKQKSRDLGR
jgi:elongation factor P--beta-lysine ligase